MDLAGDLDDDYFQQSADDLLSNDTPTEELLSDLDKTNFQREILFNKLLPYADELDNEADALLAKVKANLGRCVMLREIKPGCVFWSNMLHK